MQFEREVQAYRVWIVRYEDWAPASWHELPPRMVAVAPAEEGSLTAEGAAVYVAAYNQVMLSAPQDRWAVSVPVSVRYAGDLEVGQVLGPDRVCSIPPETAC